MISSEVDNLVGHLFRKESGKMVSALTRLLGFENFQTAEDIVQDTLIKAMSAWKFKGIPENPSSWMYAVAKRQAIDILRQRKLHAILNQEIAQQLSSEWTLVPTVNHFFSDGEIEDSQLRMMFACCHPSLPHDAQVTFILKTLCGLSVQEIAKCFLTTEDTIAKRLFRVRDKIRQEKLALDFPANSELPQRIEAIQLTLYLLFNEGYHSSHPDQLIREDLCAEAIRLSLILVNNKLTSSPASHALLSLMCLQAAREDSRLDSNGNIVLLRDQDRSKWNQQLIGIGLHHLDLATETDSVGVYQLEAAIAACHATAKTFENTDWNRIVKLYTNLEVLKPAPIIALNKAIAKGFAESADAGIKSILEISELADHHLYHTALGDFYEQLDDVANARQSFERARHLASTASEKQFLDHRLSRLSQHTIENQ